MGPKRRKTDAPKAERLAAQVFLRSRSGKPVRDLQHATPADLTEYQPDERTLAAARQAFEALGFRVFSDSTGIALTIDGRPELFTKVFKTSKDKLERYLSSPHSLSVPGDVVHIVEEVHMLPPPELHA